MRKSNIPFPDRVKISDADFYWLIGLLEGEGSFRSVTTTVKNQCYVYPHITLCMVDKDVIVRAAAIMRVASIREPKLRGVDRQQIYLFTVTGEVAAKWMELLQPYMGDRRKDQIIDTLLKYYRKGS